MPDLSRPILRVLLFLIVLAVTPAAGGEPARNEAQSPPTLVPVVLATHPHDPTAFTQGLLFYNGHLYESTGLYGRSELRKLDLKTGKVLRRVPLESRFFGEGLARVGGQLIQLTWWENTAFVYDLNTFARIKTHSYKGEGWGLCFDGRYLYRSDGSNKLFLHDFNTFKVVGTVSVTRGGRAQANLNELACVGEDIYANVYLTDDIVRIDKHSGRVTARIDAGNLLTPRERAALSAGATLNGIAHDPSEDVFYLTGKLWPKLFKVRFQ
jgi:glutaminyl-peptide cyclotransferase